MSSENYLCYCMYLVSNLSIIIHIRFSKCSKNNIQKCKSGLAVLSTGLIHIGMEKWHKVLSELEQRFNQPSPAKQQYPQSTYPPLIMGWAGGMVQSSKRLVSTAGLPVKYVPVHFLYSQKGAMAFRVSIARSSTLYSRIILFLTHAPQKDCFSAVLFFLSYFHFKV